jgi:hypothetical protein
MEKVTITAKQLDFILCKDYTRAGFFTAKLVAEWEITSAECIKCITYNSTGESLGKLTNMNKTKFRFGHVGENTPRVVDTPCTHELSTMANQEINTGRKITDCANGA